MRLGKHIHHLLHQYDCVIIPDFGGFVSNYKPSRINPVKHQFYPPGKHVIFNKHLKNNDGLLANAIAMSKNCSFEEAMQFIAKEVKRIKRKLAKNELVRLKGLGSFHQDIDGNIIFESDQNTNFLPEAFGLKVFQSLPVETEDSGEEGKIIPLNTSSGSELAKVARIAAAASILIAAFWIPIKSDVINMAGLNEQFNQLFNTTPAVYSNKQSALTFTDASVEKATSWDENSKEISLLEEHEILPNSKSSILIFDEKKKELAVKSSTIGKYQIVGGCFEFKSNAEKLVRQLSKKGYQASITGMRHGLYVVAYDTFNDADSASSALKTIKLRENQNAWLLVK